MTALDGPDSIFVASYHTDTSNLYNAKSRMMPQIFQFHNLDNQVKLDDNRKANSDIVIRTRSNSDNKKPAVVEYLPLSALSSSEKISVDTEV